jgi:hypothetical protein
MKKIKESRPGLILYMDTDSIAFMHEGYYRPYVANFLGEMTNEITEEFDLGSKMTEFYTCGSKIYSYKVMKEDGTVVRKLKAKGVTQTVESNEILSFELIQKQDIYKARNRSNKQHLFLKCNLEPIRNMRSQLF